jgi:hypothetical protein
MLKLTVQPPSQPKHVANVSPSGGNDDRTLVGSIEKVDTMRKSEDSIDLLLAHAIHLEKVLTISFGFKRTCQKECVKFWTLLDLPSLEKALKWGYADLFSLCTDQPEPKNPYPEKIKRYSLWGPYKGFLKGVIRSTLSRTRSSDRHRREMGLSRAQDLLYGKKGSPVVSEWLIKNQRKSHKENLTKRVQRPETDERCTTVVMVCEKIDEILDSCFGGKKFVVPETPKFPSLNSATVEYIGKGRRKGIRSAPMVQIIQDRRVFTLPEMDEQLYSIRPFGPHFDTTDRDSWKDVDTNLFVGDGRLDFSFLSYDNWKRQYLYMNYHPRVGVIERYRHPWSCSLPENTGKTRFLAKPAFVREPLKVRPILMGPAEEYFQLFQLQSFLWNNLKRFPTFSLIGEPCTDQKLRDIYISKADELFGKNYMQKGYKHHSGDYESATDNFCPYFSRYIWEGIDKRSSLGPHLARLGKKCLVGHSICYDDQKHQLLNQSNGQSMGSPVSFPELCILNAAVCAVAHDLGRDWSDSPVHWTRLPMCINGDDCLNLFNEKSEKAWSEVGSAVGLTPSVGKTYFSDWFAVINSQCYTILDDEIRKVEYFNYCLLSEHDSRGSSKRHWSSLASCLEKWYKCTEGRLMPSQALGHFLTSHGELLRRVPQGMSWWLPEELGGLGLRWDGEN